jgi:hypothetical protein
VLHLGGSEQWIFLIDLKNLDNIIDNHNGRPKISVKIRCLDVLKKYGIRPKRLIIMMVKNRVDTIWFSPLRLFMNVRASCALISKINGIIREFARALAIQNDS